MTRVFGLILFFISCLLWCFVPLVPFLSFSIVTKASLVTSLIILAEFVWWLSFLLLGKDLIKIFKNSFYKIKDIKRIFPSNQKIKRKFLKVFYGNNSKS